MLKAILPNEGENVPFKFPIYLDELVPGDTLNFHAPCTLTFYERKGNVLIYEVSDLKFDEPKD